MQRAAAVIPYRDTLAMRPAEFFIEPDTNNTVENELFSGLLGGPKRRLNENLIDELRRRPLADKTDIEVAVPLARLVHDELQAFGTRRQQRTE
jgi:hypothetical protein